MRPFDTRAYDASVALPSNASDDSDQTMAEAPTSDVPTRDLPRERQEAIHRALLAGLLGNVGVKKDKREFEGAAEKSSPSFPARHCSSAARSG